MSPEPISKTHRIVITGAPASGKSDFLARLRGFLPEIARSLLESNPDYRHNWGVFHREVYRRQTAQEDALVDQSFITDRGTCDAFAFHPETAADVGTTIAREYARYNLVIQLESAANLGAEFYVQDDVRIESIEDVLAIEAVTTRVWHEHPDYRFVPAEEDVEVKYRRVVEILRGRLG